MADMSTKFSRKASALLRSLRGRRWKMLRDATVRRLVRRTYTSAWSGHKEVYHDAVCPVCDAANKKLPRGQGWFLGDAYAANERAELGLTRTEVKQIMRAADHPDNARRKELMRLLGMKGSARD